MSLRAPAVRRAVCLFALAADAGPALGQHFVYVEANIAACPPAPAPAGAKPVQLGARTVGSLKVPCGFEQGSYTVRLNASDPGATFSPQTFLVNFGRIVGNGSFTVTFSTPGLHRISAAITSNMGSPPVRGRFMSVVSEFNVAPP